jgi:hypothetical protein
MQGVADISARRFMLKSISVKLLTGAMLASLAVGVIGCGSKVSGKYLAAGGAVTADFESGKVTMTSAITSQPEVDDYTVSGNQVTIKTSDGDQVLTIMSDGSLQGNGVTFTKAAN